MSPTRIPYENSKTLKESFEHLFTQKFADFLSVGWCVPAEEVPLLEKEYGKYHQQKYVQFK